jgi:uncharacterized protein (TIGR02466 family)
MGKIETYFATRIYQAETAQKLLRELKRSCLAIACDDRAGQAWCRANNYSGYTSYASLNDLPWRFPVFAGLEKLIDTHVALFARTLDFDLGRKRLSCNSLWINVMPQGAYHASHLHPHSAISGTFYVAIPRGAGAITFEDPRHGLMMAAPLRKKTAYRENRSHVTIAPKSGTLLLWESWLRHEVPVNQAKGERISVSFNYS